MIRKSTIFTYFRIAACLLAAMSMLSAVSCMREATDFSESAGVGRDVEPEPETVTPPIAQDETAPDELDSDKSDNAPPLDAPESGKTETASPEDDDKTASVGKAWEIVNGKYVYNFEPRDKTAQNDLSDMVGFSTAAFEDQPDDWYFGKTTYDESTGEVTYGWDRYQSTLDKLAQYHTIYRGDTSRKVCYLTFDCGYEFGPTSDILDTLKEKQAPGVFFLTGQYVREEKELIQRMLDEGHIVGNHTASHLRGTQLTAQEFVDELQELEDMFCAQFPDATPMRYYRPPYGNCNEYTLKLADKMGYTTVMWSYTYMDYDTENQASYADAMAKVKSGLHPGAVYLFHTESTTNAAILGDFIDWVRAQGYEILPICDVTFE